MYVLNYWDVRDGLNYDNLDSSVIQLAIKRLFIHQVYYWLVGVPLLYFSEGWVRWFWRITFLRLRRGREETGLFFVPPRNFLQCALFIALFGNLQTDLSSQER